MHFFHTFFYSDFFSFFIGVRIEEYYASYITEHTLWKQMWIRKEPDADGYFLLMVERTDMFLTAENASSVTIARKLCFATFLLTNNE